MRTDFSPDDLQALKDELRIRMEYAHGCSDALSPMAHPAPSRIPVLPEAQAAFTKALKGLPRCHDTSPRWWLKVAMRQYESRCVYCGEPVSETVMEGSSKVKRASVDHVVPTTGGGPDHHDAIVLCCVACNTSKSSTDWILWGKAVDREAITAFRAKRGRESWNHLARDPTVTKTKLKVERMLDARWSYARFKCYASVTTGGAFIGWRDNQAVPGEIYWMLRQMGGQAVNTGGGATHDLDGTPGKLRRGRPNLQAPVIMTFHLPRQAVLAIWALIERNALVHRLDFSPAFPDATPPENPALANWTFTSPNVGDLVRRRFAIPGKWKRHSEAWSKGLVVRTVRAGDTLKD